MSDLQYELVPAVMQDVLPMPVFGPEPAPVELCEHPPLPFFSEAVEAGAVGVACASRRNMDALVALRMVSFPVPPMPVMATQGEDARDGTASSWDLLAAALRCQLLQPHPAGLDDQQRIGVEKGRLLVDMFRDVVAVWQKYKSGALTADAALSQCYSVWQHTFRQYFAFFPGSSDLRFLPVDDVPRDSVVHTQALQFLRNQAYTVVDDGGVLTDIAAARDSRSYKQVLQRYVEELYAQAQDVDERR